MKLCYVDFLHVLILILYLIKKMLSLGDIIKDCVRVYNTYFRNSRIKFITRQANEVAHVLTRVATSLASFHHFIDVPICIGNIFNNE